MTQKVFVIDTCCILNDPMCIFNFDSNLVVVPLGVLDQLDNMKNRGDSVGRNSRIFSRTLDKLRSQGSLFDGVPTPKGGLIQVKAIKNEEIIQRLPIEIRQDTVDNAILGLAMEIGGIVVTQDCNLRLKADAVGIVAQDYLSNKVNQDESYEGHTETLMDGGSINELFSVGVKTNDPYLENEVLTVRNENNLNQSVLAIFKNGVIHALPKLNAVNGIVPRNREQQFALHLLLDQTIPLVTIAGKAGTGKSLLALAAGLAGVQAKTYNKILVARSTVSVGNDIGFLPGSIEEKLNPYLAPIRDNLDVICGYATKRGDKRSAFEDLVEQGIVQAESLAHIRGRSIPNQYFIIDEAQNMTQHEAKTVITRCGEGTKIVLLGDGSQVDSPYLDAENNGLSYVIDKMKESPLAAHISLHKGERSALSEDAANRL